MPRAERTPRKYEMMIVVAPTVADEGLPAVVERVQGYVTAVGGSVVRVNPENPWGRRRLAYKIQNFDHAYYVLYHFLAQPSTIGEIERELALDSVVIRHLIVRYDPLAERADRSPFDAPEPGSEEDEVVDQDNATDAVDEAEVEADAGAEQAESDDAAGAGEADETEEAAGEDDAEDEPEAESDEAADDEDEQAE